MRVKGAQDYNNKVIEFAQANTKAALDFVQKLSGVKSPSDFIELSTDHSREQFETLPAQGEQRRSSYFNIRRGNLLTGTKSSGER